MAMMNSRSLEFVEEMTECFREPLPGVFNSTLESTLVHSTCNETMLVKIEAYMKPLLELDFVLALIYSCIMGVAVCVGTFGNIIILVVTSGTRTMNRVGRDFVINLALADLCVAAVADPMCILGVVKGEKWFQSRWILCEAVASMCLSACFCAFLSLTVLSVNRYVFVCRNTLYHRIFRRPVCITLCLVCWVAAFLFEFPNFVGWGGHYFDKKNHQCIWDRTASFSYTVFVSAALIGGPLLTIGLCFVLVFRKIWRTKKDVFSLDTDDPMRMRRVWKEALRSSRTLVIIFAAFVVCWTPYAIITALDVEDNFSTEVHLFVTMLAHLHSSLNFTIYMCTNKSFRQAVYALLCCGLTQLRIFSYRSSTDTDKTTDSYARNGDELSKKYYINAGLQYIKSLENSSKNPSVSNMANGKGYNFVDIEGDRRCSSGSNENSQKY